MKNLLGIIGILITSGALAASPDIRNVCASGCPYTNAQTAITAIITDMNSSCDHMGIILLKAGETHAGKINFGSKTCEQPLVIQTSRYRELPNRRITPADVSLLAKLTIGVDGYAVVAGCWYPGAIGAFGDACTSTPAVRNVLIRGIEVEAITNSQANWAAMLIGDASPIKGGRFITVQRWEWLPSNLHVDQCYIHDAPDILMQAATKFNGTSGKITRSYIDEIAYPNDSQAVGVVAARGLTIEDNFMSVSGESLLVGGSGPNGTSYPTVDGERNSMVLHGNYSFKDPDFYARGTETTDPTSNPCYEGGTWWNTVSGQWWKCTNNAWVHTSTPTWGPGEALVKNHYEAKDGFVELTGNMAVGGWTQAQNSQCIHIPSFSVYPNAWAGAKIIGNYCYGTGGFVTGLSYLVYVDGMTIQNNLAVNMWHPDQTAGEPARQAFHVSAQKNLIYRNNTTNNLNPGVWAQITDGITEPPPAARGFNGVAYLGDNAIGATGYSAFMSGGVNTICNLNMAREAKAAIDFSRLGAVVGTAGDVGPSCAIPYTSMFDFPRPKWLSAYPLAATDAAMWTSTGTINWPTFLDTVQDWTINAALTGAKAASINGKDMGADIPLVMAYTANVASGVGGYRPFELKSVVKSGSDIVVYYNGPDATTTCTAHKSSFENFSSSSTANSNTRYGLGGKATFTAPASGKWSVRIQCGDFWSDQIMVI